MAFHLLGKAVCQPGEPAHGHAHREVLALRVEWGDVLGLGLALDAGFLDAGAFGRAVAARSGMLIVKHNIRDSQ